MTVLPGPQSPGPGLRPETAGNQEHGLSCLPASLRPAALWWESPSWVTDQQLSGCSAGALGPAGRRRPPPGGPKEAASRCRAPAVCLPPGRSSLQMGSQDPRPSPEKQEHLAGSVGSRGTGTCQGHRGRSQTQDCLIPKPRPPLETRAALDRCACSAAWEHREGPPPPPAVGGSRGPCSTGFSVGHLR